MLTKSYAKLEKYIQLIYWYMLIYTLVYNIKIVNKWNKIVVNLNIISLYVKITKGLNQFSLFVICCYSVNSVLMLSCGYMSLQICIDLLYLVNK